jgi:hypothetical protein
MQAKTVRALWPLLENSRVSQVEKPKMAANCVPQRVFLFPMQRAFDWSFV